MNKYKIVRIKNYTVELWFVIDEIGQPIESFDCWQDANNYARQLYSIGMKSTNGLDIIASNGTTTNKLK